MAKESVPWPYCRLWGSLYCKGKVPTSDMYSPHRRGQSRIPHRPKMCFQYDFLGDRYPRSIDRGIVPMERQGTHPGSESWNRDTGNSIVYCFSRHTDSAPIIFNVYHFSRLTDRYRYSTKNRNGIGPDFLVLIF
jgi:hypothetical protein